MSEVTYAVVEHDGGWAYKFDGVFSETFPTRAAAEEAVTRVASEQRIPGETEVISWQDAKGVWHEETESGGDRPDVRIEGGRLGALDAALRPQNDQQIEHALGLARRQVLDNRLIALVAAATVGYLIGRTS